MTNVTPTAAADQVVYWPGFCGNESEDWAFWSDRISVNTALPDFTLCFQSTVLVWVPCGFLWLCLPIYLIVLRWSKTVYRCGDAGKLNLTKVILGIFLCFTSLLDLFRALSEHTSGEYQYPVIYVASSVYFVTYALMTWLTHYEYRKGVHSSGISFIFWLLSVVCAIVPFRSFILHTNGAEGEVEDMFRFVIFYVNFALICIQFVLVWFADTSAIPSERKRQYETEIAGEERVPLLGSTKVSNGNKSKGKNGSGTEVQHEPCPELKTPFFSRITYWWITGLIIRGYRKALVFDDLWDIRPQEKSEPCYEIFQKQWREQLAKCEESKEATYHYQNRHGETYSYQGKSGHSGLKEGRSSKGPMKKTPSLGMAFTKGYGPYYVLGGFFKLIYDIMSFLQPLILSLLIDFVSSKDPLEWHGYLYGIVLFLFATIKSFANQQYSDVCYKFGMKIRSAVIAAIYRKALTLSSSAKKNTTQGEIVNLMSVDAQKLQDAPVYLHFIWSAPITIVVCLIMLWQQLGPAVLAGLGVLILMVPINAVIAGKIKKYQTSQMKHKDTRLKVMNEILNGIKVLKLYAWEPSFEDKVNGIRATEIEELKKAAYLNALTSVTWFVAPTLVALASFATYSYMDPNNYLDAQRAFVSLSYFNVMNFPMTILPAVIAYVVQAIVSTKRLTKFLISDDIDADNVETDHSISEPIAIRDGSFRWGRDDTDVLKNVNFSVKEGSIVAVVGHVGSGKSSLVSAILGDMYKSSGLVHVRGSMAYVPQQAWILNETLEKNITFGKEMKKSKYDRCIEACALASDFKILPGGDQTEIGDKGINLSGGQKQRVSLARAVYQNAEMYILDDPLSAVDAHVGKHIFDKVIGNEGLLREKTRILVTHGISYLPKVDYILVLNDGVISEMGTYRDLLTHDGPFAEFLKTYLQEDNEEEEDDPEAQEFRKELRRHISTISGDEGSGWDSEGVLSGDETTRRKRRTSRRLSSSKSIEGDLDKLKKDIEKQQTLTTVETAETGEVKRAIYLEYIKANGSWVFLGMFLAYVCFIAASIGTNIWLSIWSNDPPELAKENKDLRVGVYGALGVTQGIFIFFQGLCVAIGTISASGLLHKRLVARIMRAPSSFFDTTPLGRIINRISKDIDTVDVLIPITMRIWMLTFAQVLATIIIISYSFAVFLAALVPLGILYYFAQKFYICTSRQLKRIDSIRRSPIYSHFGTSVVGASSIRCYGEQERFIQTSDRLVDEGNMAYYANIMSNRWLGISLELIGNIIILLAAIFAVAFRETIDPGLVGLSVSYALQVTGSLNFMVRTSCDMETYIVSVERIFEYAQIACEAAWERPIYKPDAGWPNQGAVEFKNYSVRYREGLDLVLQDITCNIRAGEKVGIVGRTGAGKSSLTLALFRLIEAAEGAIVIDGHEIGKLGLHDLRNKLTIIPQDPVLFSGDIRSNLDPFNHHTDADIWSALEHSHLKSFVAGLQERLQYEVSENGDNLSVGQRQLVCLARALLRRTKILILDEATAAVDLETDDLIQNTIRVEFTGCTVLTIAHRLNTIMDYDRVIVLDKGKIKEYDTPSNLLKEKHSIFHGMARDAGLV
ncbi:multidrug resistance-associated protein 1-like [Lineus longissimus]|uniref:multidrug resistance-associated protein 1-like n=1 Tax=Lineus longissimus TaxID=88925 RepID=UPI002B4EBC23